MKSVVGWIWATFDVRDVTLVMGLLILSAGLSMVSAPLALIVPGAVLTMVAIFGPRLAEPPAPSREE